MKKIYDKWEQKKLKREKLIKNFFSINTNTAGEEACTKILEYNNNCHLLKEGRILNQDPEIICLQEVEHFQEFFISIL